MKGSELICAFHTIKPHSKELFKEQAKNKIKKSTVLKQISNRREARNTQLLCDV